MKMTVFLDASGWFDFPSDVSFEVKDLAMARDIVDVMIMNGSKVRNAVVYDVIELKSSANVIERSRECKMCGNDWKSLNSDGYCSSCWQVWKG